MNKDEFKTKINSKLLQMKILIKKLKEPFIKTIIFILKPFSLRRIRAVIGGLIKLIENNPIKCFFTYFIFLSIISFYVREIPKVSQGNIEAILGSFYGFPYINQVTALDKDKIDLITSGLLGAFNKFFTVSLPITLTFYYFTYREQKSISSNLAKGFPLILYFSTTISVIALGLLLTYNNSLYDNKLFFSQEYFYQIIVWIVLIVLSFISMINLVHKLLNSMDLDYLFNHKRIKILKKIKELYYTNINFKNNYRDLNLYLETIFQSFDYAIDKKLDQTFETEFTNWNAILQYIFDDKPNKKAKIIIANKLMDKRDKEEEEFINFYKMIIKKQGNLLFKLADENKLEDLKTGLETVKALEPNKVNKLYQTYFTALEEIAIKAYNHKTFPINELLDIFKNITSSYQSNNTEAVTNDSNSIFFKTIGIIYIYQSLLKEAVENDAVRNVTSITYSLCSILHALQKNEILASNQSTKAVVFQQDEVNNDALNFAMEKSIEGQKFSLQNEDYDKINEVILFILFQMALKAIELSHYKTAGQLIKRITTDFPSHLIKNVYEQFRLSKGEVKNSELIKDHLVMRALQSEDCMISKIHTDIKFNELSLDYCLQKLAILILGQEKYIMEKNLNFTKFFKSFKEIPLYIDLAFVDIEYLDYTIQKIIQVGKAYGLLFVEDPNFTNYIKESLGATSS